MCNNEAKLLDEILYDLGERYEKDVFWTVSTMIEKYKKKREELDVRKCVLCACPIRLYNIYICDECQEKHRVKEAEIIEKVKNYGTGTG